MTIAEMREQKKELGYTCAQISDLSGVPLGTVQRIFNGAEASPHYETLQALSKLFESAQAQTSQVRESVPAYAADEPANCIPKSREGYTIADSTVANYTIEDYYKLPEPLRFELINGVLYNMASPSLVHQLIAGYLFTEFSNHVRTHKGSCLPVSSPVDVQLDCDDRTMLQPDIVIVCDRDKLIHHCIYGAPDLVVEVLSPSTEKKDAFLKLNKHMNAGVREYWMIDPQKNRVIVYDFAHDDYPVLYTFDDVVPVQIWNGACRIDFKEVYAHIRFLYERE